MNSSAKIAVGIGVVSLTLTGCGMFQGSRNTEKTLSSPTPPVLKDQVIGAAGKVEAPMDISIPNWYVKPPSASENYVWTTGTGFSNDLAMSRKKAMLDSQVQLADKINGVISAMVRQSMRDDQGNNTVDRSSSFIKKVIIETALLTDDEKVRACLAAKNAGADFVKTSTGYGTGGATIDDLKLMRAASPPQVKVKAAGGVRDLEKAIEVIGLGVARIGASATAAILDPWRERLGLPKIENQAGSAPTSSY